MPVLYCPPCSLAHATPFPVWQFLRHNLAHGAQVLVWGEKGYGPVTQPAVRQALKKGQALQEVAGASSRPLSMIRPCLRNQTWPPQ